MEIIILCIVFSLSLSSLILSLITLIYLIPYAAKQKITKEAFDYKAYKARSVENRFTNDSFEETEQDNDTLSESEKMQFQNFFNYDGTSKNQKNVDRK